MTKRKVAAVVAGILMTGSVASAQDTRWNLDEGFKASQEGWERVRHFRAEEVARCAKSKDPVLCELLVVRLQILEETVRDPRRHPILILESATRHP
jgi:hypothetical protein